MNIQTPSISEVLSNTEIKHLVTAFLRHPNRVEKGASEEDIIKVINWAHELKLQAEINLAILKEVYSGNIVLNMQDNDVVMSMSNPNVH